MRLDQKIKKQFFGFISTFLLVTTILTATFGADSSLAGSWRGTFQTPGPTGSLELILTGTGNKWSGEVKIEGPGHKILTKPAQKLNVDGENLTFMIEMVGAEINFTGKLKDGKLTGELEAVENGKTLAMGSWEMTRAEK